MTSKRLLVVSLAALGIFVGCAPLSTPPTPTVLFTPSSPPTGTVVAPVTAANTPSTSASNAVPTIGPIVLTPTLALPTPTIEYYPVNEKPWSKIPNIVISSAKNDPRIPFAEKAVEHWNQQLRELGAPFHLGTVTQTTDLLPGADLKAIGDPGSPGQLSAETVRLIQKMPGDLVIALSDATFVSVTHPVGPKKLIAIQAHPGGGDSATNIENVIAHEMGHSIGLGHNNDPTKLMCGRPSTCRPGADQFVSTEGFAPLTDEEKAYLLKIYPLNWKPAQ